MALAYTLAAAAAAHTHTTASNMFFPYNESSLIISIKRANIVYENINMDHVQ